MQVPPFRFPEIATPRVMHGTRTVLNEQFYSDRERRPQGLDEHGIYAGHEDEWRKFKLGLSARTVGPRLRAVAALNDFQPEAPSRELPPLLARRLRERQANPWREANLRDELRYNRIQETPRIPANPQARASVLARAPSQAQDLSQLQPHEQQQMPFPRAVLLGVIPDAGIRSSCAVPRHSTTRKGLRTSFAVGRNLRWCTAPRRHVVQGIARPAASKRTDTARSSSVSSESRRVHRLISRPSNEHRCA